MAQELDFDTKVFDKETIEVAGTTEAIVRGGRHLLPLLRAAPAARGKRAGISRPIHGRKT